MERWERRRSMVSARAIGAHGSKRAMLTIVEQLAVDAHVQDGAFFLLVAIEAALNVHLAAVQHPFCHVVVYCGEVRSGMRRTNQHDGVQMRRLK